MVSRLLCFASTLALIAIPATVEAQRQVRVTASSTNVREAPGSDQPVIGAVRAGTVLDVIRETNSWFQVRLPANLGLNASNGYILASAVELVTASNSPSRSSGPRASSTSSPTSLNAFDQGRTIIGPRVGIATRGSTAMVGANFERGVTPLIGIGAFADYWSYNDNVTGGDLDYTYTAIGLTGSYHYNMLEDKRLDPFVGVALGYYIVSSGDSQLCRQIDCSLSRGFLGGFAGIRYYIIPSVAGTLRAGFGASYLSAGIDWRF